MPRKQSDATALRTLRGAFKVMQNQLRITQLQLQSASSRADAAETEAVEWKDRFDKLLERTPKIDSGG